MRRSVRLVALIVFGIVRVFVHIQFRFGKLDVGRDLVRRQVSRSDLPQ